MLSTEHQQGQLAFDLLHILFPSLPFLFYLLDLHQLFFFLQSLSPPLLLSSFTK